MIEPKIGFDRNKGQARLRVKSPLSSPNQKHDANFASCFYDYQKNAALALQQLILLGLFFLRSRERWHFKDRVQPKVL